MRNSVKLAADYDAVETSSCQYPFHCEGKALSGGLSLNKGAVGRVRLSPGRIFARLLLLKVKFGILGEPESGGGYELFSLKLFCSVKQPVNRELDLRKP